MSFIVDDTRQITINVTGVVVGPKAKIVNINAPSSVNINDEFLVIATIKNIGDQTGTIGCEIAEVTGSLKTQSGVAPNQSVNFSWTLKAPSTPGTMTLTFKAGHIG